MDALSKEYLVDFYSKNLMIHGDRPEALRWSASGQLDRYEAILQCLNLTPGKTLLDYGCGKGDLYSYITGKGARVEYHGADITPGFIELARSKYPGIDFRVLDAEDEGLWRDFDLVVMCGVFNNRVQGVRESLEGTLKAIMPRTLEALCFNVLSGASKDRQHDLNYYDPIELSAFIHENITHDFTMKTISDDLFFVLRANRK